MDNNDVELLASLINELLVICRNSQISSKATY